MQSPSTQPKIVTLTLPEYVIDHQPDYITIGAKIDRTVESNFEGTFLERALSLADHPQYTLDQLTNIIVKTGTDKYDLNRKGVCHEEFEPYRADFQAGSIEVRNEKLTEPFGQGLLKLFYENVLLDRGYRLRLDLILLYDPKQVEQAHKEDHTRPGTKPHLEEYLWRFKYPTQKAKALMGIIQLLR